MKAIAILGEQGLDKLVEVARGLQKTQTAELQACLKHFQAQVACARTRDASAGDIQGCSH